MLKTHSTRRRMRCKSMSAVLVGLVLAASGLAPANARTAPLPTAQDTGASLPSAQEVLDRFVSALGGEEALRKHSSQTKKGELEMMAGSKTIEGDLTIYKTAPDRMLMIVESPVTGLSRQCYDGNVGWTLDSGRANVMTGSQLEVMGREADYFLELNLATHFPTIEVSSRTAFQGKICYMLKLVTAAGEESQAFFDTETGLLVATRQMMETPVGRTLVATIYEDYKPFDGIMIPTVERTEFGGARQTLRFTDVQFDDVDPDVYELPDEITEILENRQPASQPDDV